MKYYDLSRLFNNQPRFLTGKNVHLAGAWFRTRISDIPIGFGDETRARFTEEMNINAVTRLDLINDEGLLNIYCD